MRIAMLTECEPSSKKSEKEGGGKRRQGERRETEVSAELSQVCDGGKCVLMSALWCLQAGARRGQEAGFDKTQRQTRGGERLLTDFKVRRETTPTGSDATPHPHGIRKDGGGEHDTWDGTGTASTDEGRDEGDGRVRRRRARGAGPNDSRAFPDFRSAVGFLSGRHHRPKSLPKSPSPLDSRKLSCFQITKVVTPFDQTSDTNNSRFFIFSLTCKPLDSDIDKRSKVTSPW